MPYFFTAATGALPVDSVFSVVSDSDPVLVPEPPHENKNRITGIKLSKSIFFILNRLG
jgi:hypothetical protein